MQIEIVVVITSILNHNRHPLRFAGVSTQKVQVHSGASQASELCLFSCEAQRFN